MSHRKAIVALFWAAYLVCFFVLARVIIPGLINMHNDGALILAIVLGFAIPITAYLLHNFLQSLEWKEPR